MRNTIYEHRTFLLLAILLILAPIVLYPLFVMKFISYALFAMAFALLLRYAGLMAFGHAAYFGLGSYVSGYALKYFHISPEVAILLALVCCSALGVFFGALVVRKQGIVFALTTLALSQMVYFISLQWTSVTGGEDGIQAVPRGYLLGLIDLGNDTNLYYFVIALFLAIFLFLQRVTTSPFGNALRAVRDNEQRAISLGYQTHRLKLIVYVISAAMSGAAGGVKVLVMQVATLADVHLNMSIEPVIMTLLGGIGTLLGPIVGALIVTSMENYLAGLGAWVVFFKGLILVACVMLFRDGIVEFVGQLIRYFSRRAGFEPKTIARYEVKSESAEMG